MILSVTVKKTAFANRNLERSVTLLMTRGSAASYGEALKEPRKGGWSSINQFLYNPFIIMKQQNCKKKKRFMVMYLVIWSHLYAPCY